MPEMPLDVPRMTVTDEKAREIEAKLHVISGGEVYEVDVEPEAEAQEATGEVAEDATKTESETAVEDTVVESETEEAADEKSDKPGAPPEPADESPTLPGNFVRSLKATGWSDEEIQASIDHDFDITLKMAEKVHDNRLRETNEWAAHGRFMRQEEPSTPSTEESSSSQSPQAPQQLSRVDAEALKTEYGEDEAVAALIDRISGPVNKAIEAMNLMLPQIAESTARQQDSENAITEKEVEAFFRSPDLAAFAKFYGTGATRGVEPELFQNRMKVMERADQIRVGASYQGRDIGFSDALAVAHESVSSTFQMQAIREDIKGKVQKRSKSVSLKPSKTQSTTSSSDRTPKSREDLYRTSEIALRKIFNR